ncbi:11496_t:CDS:2 [Acaulospora colombiana]|uniref:11496_t:CDS:1 n=1 Tax=Acaulospora colombiana TaxID=27376 RepID=A0ACA9N745_9GLOM|nr:11496_t:CDS:2 [Acaulospora colombiana]
MPRVEDCGWKVTWWEDKRWKDKLFIGLKNDDDIKNQAIQFKKSINDQPLIVKDTCEKIDEDHEYERLFDEFIQYDDVL